MRAPYSRLAAVHVAAPEAFKECDRLEAQRWMEWKCLYGAEAFSEPTAAQE